MRAMRRDTELVDLGRMRLARSNLIRREPEGDDVLITEEVYLSEAKKMAEHALPASSSDQLKKAKLKEWDKIVKSGAIRIHVGDEARKMIQSCGSERLLQSRFVVRYCDDEEQLRQGVLKARWCIRGYLDPDLMELSTASPTLSEEGFAIALQMLARQKWGLKIGDIKGAFLKRDALQRERGRVLVRLPSTGVPGLDQSAVVELIKPVYGLADAPEAWYDTLCAALYLVGNNRSWIRVCSITTVVVKRWEFWRVMLLMISCLEVRTSSFRMSWKGCAQAFRSSAGKWDKESSLGNSWSKGITGTFMSDSKSTLCRSSAFRCAETEDVSGRVVCPRVRGER